MKTWNCGWIEEKNLICEIRFKIWKPGALARDKRDRMTNDPVDKERMNAPNLPIFQSCYLPISQSCNLANQSDEFHLQFMGKLLLSAHLIIKMFMSNQHCDSAYVKICPNLNMHFRNFILSHEKPPNARHTSLFIITKLVTILSSRLHSLLNLSPVVKFDHI